MYYCVIDQIVRQQRWWTSLYYVCVTDGQPTVTMGGAMPPMTTTSPAAYGLVPYSPIVNGGVSMPIPPPTSQQPMAQSIMTPVVNGTAVSSAPPLGQVPIRSMAYTNGYQPFVYIYPTQPISPQGQYYLTPNGMPFKGVQYSPNGDLVHYADVSYAEVRHGLYIQRIN